MVAAMELLTFEDILNFRKERTFQLMKDLAIKYNVSAKLDNKKDPNGGMVVDQDGQPEYFLVQCTAEEFSSELEACRQAKEKYKLAMWLYMLIIALNKSGAWSKGTILEQEDKMKNLLESTMRQVQEATQSTDMTAFVVVEVVLLVIVAELFVFFQLLYMIFLLDFLFLLNII